MGFVMAKSHIYCDNVHVCTFHIKLAAGNILRVDNEEHYIVREVISVGEEYRCNVDKGVLGYDFGVVRDE